MSGSPSMRTPLARVRSLGSSHSGTRDFWRQRLTAAAMVLLIVPVIVIVVMLLGSNHAGAGQLLGHLPIAGFSAICAGTTPASAAAIRANSAITAPLPSRRRPSWREAPAAPPCPSR